MDKLLLHTCCAPCSVYCVDSLRAEGIEPTAFWYNPNIHPYQEYKARRDTLVDYAAAIGLDKKGAGADITLILLDRMGHAVPHKLPKEELLRLLDSFHNVP